MYLVLVLTLAIMDQGKLILSKYFLILILFANFFFFFSMKFSANFVEDGTISFDYQVVAENGAGLQFFIDGTMQQGVWRSETTTRITFQVKKGFFFF